MVVAPGPVYPSSFLQNELPGHCSSFSALYRMGCASFKLVVGLCSNRNTTAAAQHAATLLMALLVDSGGKVGVAVCAWELSRGKTFVLFGFALQFGHTSYALIFSSSRKTVLALFGLFSTRAALPPTPWTGEHPSRRLQVQFGPDLGVNVCDRDSRLWQQMSQLAACEVCSVLPRCDRCGSVYFAELGKLAGQAVHQRQHCEVLSQPGWPNNTSMATIGASTSGSGPLVGDD